MDGGGGVADRGAPRPRRRMAGGRASSPWIPALSRRAMPSDLSDTALAGPVIEALVGGIIHGFIKERVRKDCTPVQTQTQGQAWGRRQ